MKLTSDQLREITSRLAAKPLVLYVRAFACDEDGMAPSWAIVPVNPTFLDVLLEMQAVCLDKKLAEVTRPWAGHMWASDSDDLFDLETLVVNRRSWHLRSRPRNFDFYVETHELQISWLLAVLDGKSEGPAADFITRRDDVLMYDPTGEPDDFLEELIDAGELPEAMRRDNA